MIVVDPAEGDVLRHLQAGVVGIEHLLVGDEELRHLRNIAEILRQQIALEADNLRQAPYLVLGSGIARDAPVVHASHTQGVHAVDADALGHTLLPIALNLRLVRHIVPILVHTVPRLVAPLPLVVAQHLLAMAGAQHDVVLAGYRQVVLVGPESLRAEVHGRPQGVGLEAQQQLHHPGVGVGTDVVVLLVDALGGPGLQAPVLVVDEDAAILHRRLTHRQLGAHSIERFLLLRSHVGPPYPRRHACQTRQLEESVGRATRRAADDDEGTPDAFLRLLHHL